MNERPDIRRCLRGSLTVRKKILPPSSLSMSKSSKEPERTKQLISCFVYSSTVKMEAVSELLPDYTESHPKGQLVVCVWILAPLSARQDARA